MHRIEWSTSASTVGSKKSPARALARRPPVTTLAPLATASSTWASISSICGGKMIAPTSTEPGSPGGPCRSALTFSVTRCEEVVVDRLLDVDALNRDADLPRVVHAVATAAFAARSRSASASTIIGSLPPSSRLTGVSVAAARAMTFFPVSTDP